MDLRTPFVCLLLWLLTVPAVAAAGDTTRAHDGTLGTAPVVMELTTNTRGEVTGGRYFYTRHHLDLMLEAGHPAARHVTLAEGPDNGKPRSTTALDPTGTGARVGSWHSPAGKTLSVKLMPVVLTSPAG